MQVPQPDDVERVETGVIQFGDDWPGVFIRGDHALQFAHCLEMALSENFDRENLFHTAPIQGLINTLKGCEVKG